MNFSRRSRIISTRLSEDEYDVVDRISRETGARSVSDFVRQVVLDSTSVFPSETGTTSVAGRIAALQRKVDWLSAVVERTSHTNGQK